MPTCLASSGLRISAHLRTSHKLVQPVFRCTGRCHSLRYASTTTPKHEDQRTHVLTVLHKTTTLLPRILPRQGSTPENETGHLQRGVLDFWEDVLEKVYEDLTLTAEKRKEAGVRVVVYGVDRHSKANELVSALVEDPFVSDEQKHILRTRWMGQPEGSRKVILRYGTSHSDDVVYVQSSWLQQFDVPIELTEFKTRSSPSPDIDVDIAKMLFAADIPIIVYNPISSPLTFTLPVSTKPTTLPLSRENTILAILSPSPCHPATSVHGSQMPTLASRNNLRVVYIDPARAIHGLGMLSGGPASAIAVQRYQDDFSGSNVSSVTKAIKELLPTTSGPSTSVNVAAVHVQTGRVLIIDALATCRTVLKGAEVEAHAVLEETSTLRSQMEEAKAKVNLEVFGAPSEDGDEISRAVSEAKKTVRPTLDALQWYKLFWRVDDVREVVSAAVDRAWCRDLERKLVFHAGRLGALQTSFTDSAIALCRSFPLVSPYYSPVLQNTLARIASGPPFTLTPAALTAPLQSRQNQLAFPTARLHASAQHAVVGMSGSVLGGFGVAWVGWANELQLLGGLIDVGMSTQTALGAGLLSAAVGVRWAVSRWERAKKRWWKNWDRVGDGLERDLKAALTRTLDEQVVVVPTAACSGLEDLVATRKIQIQNLAEEVHVLEREIGSTLDQRTHTSHAL